MLIESISLVMQIWIVRDANLVFDLVIIAGKMRFGPKPNGFCWSDRVTILPWSSKSSQGCIVWLSITPAYEELY
ncbi:hypothetical protein MKW98_032028 [Papaver atlanticum]|uniref:Uncharacterized protein n=1 Tax=Papaver atlanticum TaxID=357466 RepID=A0AAD4XD38_9MAGN|nr:hypothetical protein MKW98_032028 [Papaver atlanticum]